MDPSLFATLRIVVKMLRRDGRLHSKEQTWLNWLLVRNPVSSTQRAQLLADHVDDDSLEAIYLEIARPEDRKRLINWLRIAMNIDDHNDTREKALFDRLVALDAKTRDMPVNPYAAMADALIDHDRHLHFWQAVRDLDKWARQEVPWWRRVFFRW